MEANAEEMLASDESRALEAALCALRASANEPDVLLLVRKLGEALGGKHLEASSDRAILACLDQLEHPEEFSRDQNAWEKHGAKRSAFKSWKRRIRPLMLETAISDASVTDLEALALEDQGRQQLRTSLGFAPLRGLGFRRDELGETFNSPAIEPSHPPPPPLELQSGDKAQIRGLVNRRDLNGRSATLLDWHAISGRWSVRLAGRQGCVCVHPENLSKITTAVVSKEGRETRLTEAQSQPCLNPVVAQVLRDIVRGSASSPSDDNFAEFFYSIGHGMGQISRLAFENIVLVCTEAYDFPGGFANPERAMMRMVIAFIGKSPDADLLFHALKSRLHATYHRRLLGSRMPMPIALTRMLEMSTAESVTNLMFNARKGTLAVIEAKQGHLQMLSPKDLFIKGDRDDPVKQLSMLH